jgi:hypothetical protein
MGDVSIVLAIDVACKVEDAAMPWSTLNDLILKRE